MNTRFELKAFRQGAELVGGIDEAGRGALAGPVTAACVVLAKGVKVRGLAAVRDSKQLTARQREGLADKILASFPVGIGWASNEEIDQLNILQATFLAMRRAVAATGVDTDWFLIDGPFVVPDLASRQQAIVKGDSRVFSIAAASIAAKVARDRLMREYAAEFPVYGWTGNKGYGTAKHLAAINEFGASKWHRRSFRPVAESL